jgi:hypothetical protein
MRMVATFSVEGRLMSSERALDDPMAFSDDEAADETLGNRERARRNHNGLDNDEEHVDVAEWDFGDDNEPIPPRGWLLGNLLCREFLSLFFGDGGVGKTALLIVMALSLATGRNLLNEHVFVRSRVLILCFEDGADELRRRLTAAMMHYGVSNEEIRGYLFVSVIQRPDAKLLISVPGRDFAEGKLGAAIEQAIARRKLDAVLLDPFVKAHGGPENDNIAMDMSAGILTRIAVRRDVAVGALHHNRKGPDDPGNPDIGRGGGSLKDAGRLVYTLTPMSQDEADLLGIDAEGRAALIRLDHAKVNLVRRDPRARWFKLVGVSIGKICASCSGVYNDGSNLVRVGSRLSGAANFSRPSTRQEVAWLGRFSPRVVAGLLRELGVLSRAGPAAPRQRADGINEQRLGPREIINSGRERRWDPDYVPL